MNATVDTFQDYLAEDLYSSETARPLSVAEQVRTPRYAMRLTIILLLFLVVIVPALLLAPWTQTVYGIGQVIAFNPTQRPQFVTANVEGVIVKWHVYEGQPVRRGQKLVTLRDNDPDIMPRLNREKETLEEEIRQQEQRIMVLKARVNDLKSAKESALATQDALILERESRVQEAQARVLDAEFRYETAKKNYARNKDLVDSTAVSRREFELAEQELTSTEKIFEATKQAEIASKQMLESQKKTRANVEDTNNASIQSAYADVNSANSSLESLKGRYQAFLTRFARQNNLEVLAPTDGTVFRLLANGEGNQFVRAQERLARIVPDIAPIVGIPFESEPAHLAIAGGGLLSGYRSLTDQEVPGMVAELNIDGNDVPLLKKGDRCLLQFEGWAAVQFANVPDAAVGTFEGRVFLVDPTADDKSMFRVLVEPAKTNPNGTPADPWPNQEFLRQGVRAQGWFLLEEVSVGYELWRLLNGFPIARSLDEKSKTGSIFGPVQGRGGK